MPDPERILVIRPSALGDVCRSVPVLATLRRRYPRARIDWLVRDGFVDAVRAHPDLSEAIPFPRDAFARQMRRGRFAGVLAWLRDLRARRYDLAIDAQGLARSGLFMRITGAPRRIGLADARELAWLACTERVRAPRDMHTVDRMLELARAADADPVADLTLHAPPEGREAVARECAPRKTPIVLAPTSTWPGKRWPVERFAALAERLLSETDPDTRIAVVGGPSERGQCAPLLELAERDQRVRDLVGRTSVGGLMALIERSRLVIANDSAALHIAAGFDRPLVALFGPTDTRRVGPYGREADVLQRVGPDDVLNRKDARTARTLMERISIEDVFAAAMARLEAGSSPGPRAAPAGSLSRSGPRSPS